MVQLKLGKLPDRTPVKLVISLAPDLQERLNEYAAIYATAYGQQETVAELVPAMLSLFLDSDREFVKSRRAR